MYHANVRQTTDIMEAVPLADFIFEAIPEDLNMKSALYSRACSRPVCGECGEPRGCGGVGTCWAGCEATRCGWVRAEIAPLVKRDAVVATNTMTLPVSALCRVFPGDGTVTSRTPPSPFPPYEASARSVV
jgi:hypothetical protein